MFVSISNYMATHSGAFSAPHTMCHLLSWNRKRISATLWTRKVEEKGSKVPFFSMDYFPAASFALANDSEYYGQVSLNNNSLAGY